MPANEAHSEVDPGVAGLEAFFAPFGVGLNVLNLIKVGASCDHKLKMLHPGL